MTPILDYSVIYFPVLYGQKQDAISHQHEIAYKQTILKNLCLCLD